MSKIKRRSSSKVQGADLTPMIDVVFFTVGVFHGCDQFRGRNPAV